MITLFSTTTRVIFPAVVMLCFPGPGYPVVKAWQSEEMVHA